MPSWRWRGRAFHLKRDDARAEVDAELDFHLAMRTAELIERGLPPDQARAEAERQFGDLEGARTYCRALDARREKRLMRLELWSDLRQDIAFAWRALRRSPVYAIVSIATLALGIGANTAIFSVVHGVLLAPLPYDDPDRLLAVRSVYKGQQSSSSAPNFFDARSQSRAVDVAAFFRHSGNLTAPGADPRRLALAAVSGNFARVLGVHPLAGTAFTDADERYGGPKIIMLGETLWRTQYGSDRALIGKTVTLDGDAYTVVGIVPDGLPYPSKTDAWIPMRFDPKDFAQSRGAVYLGMVGRLRTGATLASANSDLLAISRRIAHDYPDEARDLAFAPRPLRDAIVGDLSRPLYVLLGAVALVMLIACANVATLMLVRAAARESEIAVRTAIGAARNRLVRQLLTESVLVSLLGGVAAVAVAAIGVKLLVSNAPTNIPRLDAIHVDAAVLTFAFVVALLTGVIFGLIPAVQSTRASLVDAIRADARISAGRAAHHRTRNLLVVSEVALAVMLLAGAGLLMRSFSLLVRVDPGFRTEHAIAADVTLPDARYDTPDKQRVFANTMLTSIRGLGGVESAALGMSLPLSGSSFEISFQILEHPKLAPADHPAEEIRVVSSGYFETMGMPVLRGRSFTAEDRAGGAPVMAVSEAFAKRYFPNEDPLGKTIRMDWGADSAHVGGRIVAIVGDVHQSDLAGEVIPELYAPFDQWPVSSFTFVTRTKGDPTAIVAGVRGILRQVDPDLPIAKITTLDQLVSGSVSRPRFYMMLLVVFAGVALVLAAVGIYGVIAYLVTQRTHELGVRIALGAGHRDVVSMVLRQGLVLAGLGIAIGTAGGLMLTRLLETLLFNVKSWDPITFVMVAAALALVAIGASWVPARRAARVSPMVAIRAR